MPYIVATVRRATRPRLVTWLTWCLLTAVAGAASASVGDYPSAAFSLVGTLATSLVLVAGLRFGDRAFTRLDVFCLAVVLAGFMAWRVLHLPGIAVLGACLIDLVGLVPTLVHSWRQPHEETALTYGLIALGGVCASLAAWGVWTVTAQAYPVYVAVSMGGCWLILLVRRRFVPVATTDAAERVAVASVAAQPLGIAPEADVAELVAAEPMLAASALASLGGAPNATSNAASKAVAGRPRQRRPAKRQRRPAK